MKYAAIAAAVAALMIGCGREPTPQTEAQREYARVVDRARTDREVTGKISLGTALHAAAQTEAFYDEMTTEQRRILKAIIEANGDRDVANWLRRTEDKKNP